MYMRNYMKKSFQFHWTTNFVTAGNFKASFSFRIVYLCFFRIYSSFTSVFHLYLFSFSIKAHTIIFTLSSSVHFLGVSRCISHPLEFLYLLLDLHFYHFNFISSKHNKTLTVKENRNEISTGVFG